MRSAIVVTGAASGVGRAAAELLHARGLHVIATDVDAEGLASLSSATWTLTADLGFPDEVARLVAQIEGLLRDQRLDLIGLALVAGIGWSAPTVLADEELVRDTLQINALAPYTLIRGLFAALSRAPGGGRIALVSSVAGRLPQAWCGAYSMSKAALESLCDCLRFELQAAGSPVSITSLQPGLIDTPILDSALAGDPERWSTTPFYPELRRFVDMIGRMRKTRSLRPEQVAARLVEVLTARERPPPRELLVRSGGALVRLAATLPDGPRDWFRRKIVDWG